MGILIEIQNRLRKSGVLIIFVILFFYFSFYTINGERGLRRYLHLQQELSYAEKIAEKYSKKKAELEAKVRLLSSDSLDLDMLDERTRVILNYANSDEFVIIDNAENTL